MVFLKQNVYEVEKNVEKLLRGGSTGFLTNNIRMAIQSKLKGRDCQVFSPFREAEKVILYSGNSYPDIRLFMICCYKDDEIKHSSIMGSLFGLNITSEMFGDIIKWKNNFYVYLLGGICELVIKELKMIGNIPVSLKEVSGDLLKDFEREYEKNELIVSSLRIDTVISRLIGCNRDCINDKIHNQEIIINDVFVKKASSVMDVGDVFSVRRYGKFKFKDIVGKTKKDNFIIEIDKYI